MRKLAWTGALLLTVPVLGAWLTAPASPPSVLGMWSQTEPVREGDPVRFYYFHSGSIGLFRYGKMGLTQTRSFRYALEDDKLRLTFLKSGDTHVVPFEIEDGALVLADDPMLGGKQTYRHKPLARGQNLEAMDHPLSRMWKHVTRDKYGQETFHMYQLQAPALDGRGVGWYHEGDHMDWTTEALTYRKTGDKLLLDFTLRGEQAVTPVELGEGPHGRYLELERDPRNFWHKRRYPDGGPGFSVTLEHEPMPYFVPGHGLGQGGGHAVPAGHGLGHGQGGAHAVPAGHDGAQKKASGCPHAR